MSATTVIIGNLTRDPELRFIPSGAAVANFTIASTPRRFDRTTNKWEDGDTLYLNCTAWREMAENIAESLSKGMRVWANGTLKQRQFENTAGQKVTVTELEVEEAGPSLRYATAKITKNVRQDSGSSQAPASSPAQSFADEPPF